MNADLLGPPANGEHAARSADTSPPSGRDARGRFTKNNPGGPGNPFARQSAEMHRAFRSVVSHEDMQAVARKVKEMALAGNLVAVKVLCTYMIGTPQGAANPDTLDLQEWSQLKQAAPMLEEMPTVMKSLTAEDACNFARAAQPLYSEAIVNEIGEGILQQEEAEERRRERREERRQRREERRQRRAQMRAEREAVRRQTSDRSVETRQTDDRPHETQQQQPSPFGGNGSGRYDNMTAEEILEEIRSGRYRLSPEEARRARQGGRQEQNGTDANGDNGG